MADVLGLDIGGANLKAAHSRGAARSMPFALWKNPHGLTAALRATVAGMPEHDLVAVTMTGELCDCFASKREGVEEILNSVAELAGRVPVWVWTTYGQFLPLKDACQEPLRVAAANWLAGALLAGRHAPSAAALYLDIGSTTTDIVELWKGKPVPGGWTDQERLKLGELVYTGVRRTPVCALLGAQVAAEVFATTLDVYVMLDQIPEDDTDDQTADGRPATRAWSHVRLARMLGGDGETVTEQETLELARAARDRQVEILRAGMGNVRGRMPEPAGTIVVSGSGTFLARTLLASEGVSVVCVEELLDPQISSAVCAYAVACLARERSS